MNAEDRNPGGKKKIPVTVYDVEGNFLRECASLKDAEEFTGVRESAISRRISKYPNAKARDGKLEDLGFIFEPITYR